MVTFQTLIHRDVEAEKPGGRWKRERTWKHDISSGAGSRSNKSLTDASTGCHAPNPAIEMSPMTKGMTTKPIVSQVSVSFSIFVYNSTRIQ